MSGSTRRPTRESIKYDVARRCSTTAGVIPRAKIKTVKMTFVIVLSKFTYVHLNTEARDCEYLYLLRSNFGLLLFTGKQWPTAW